MTMVLSLIKNRDPQSKVFKLSVIKKMHCCNELKYCEEETEFHSNIT